MTRISKTKSGSHQFYSGSTLLATLDGSGNAINGNTTFGSGGSIAVTPVVASSQTTPVHLHQDQDNSSIRISAGSTVGTYTRIDLIGGWDGSALVGGKIKFSTNGTEVGSCETTGKWTQGLDSGGAVEHIIRSGQVAGSTILALNKTAVATGTTNSYFINFSQSGSPDGYILHDPSGNMAFANASDLRLKENIREITGLDKCLALHPVLFDWIDGTGTDNLGFIAQEVETVLPKSVGIAPDADTKMLSMQSEIIPILVRSIQEQQVMIQSLISRIEALEG